VDRAETGTVPSSHVLVHALDSIGASELTVLLVHVVGAGARVVTDPDTEVLDLEGVLLVDLIIPVSLAIVSCSLDSCYVQS